MDWLEVAKTFGLPIALLLAALASGARGMWVYGHVHRTLEADRDYWREMALRNTDLAETAVTTTRRPRRPRPP